MTTEHHYAVAPQIWSLPDVHLLDAVAPIAHATDLKNTVGPFEMGSEIGSGKIQT